LDEGDIPAIQTAVIPASGNPRPFSATFYFAHPWQATPHYST